MADRHLIERIFKKEQGPPAEVVRLVNQAQTLLAEAGLALSAQDPGGQFSDLAKAIDEAFKVLGGR